MGLLVRYAPSPQVANTRRLDKDTPHGPGLGSVWCFSRDGVRWERPDRRTEATAAVGWSPLQGPIRTGGMLRFYAGIEGNFTAGIREDRIYYAFCRANGEFSTPQFTIPQGELLLNVSADEYGSYVMVELQDPQGKVVAGFEKEKCVLMRIDQSDHPLRWNGQSTGPITGQTVQARFYLRNARIHELRASTP